MKHERIYLIVFVLLVSYTLISLFPVKHTGFFTIESTDYFVEGSAHTGLAGRIAENSNYSVRFTNNYQQPTLKAESTDYGASIGFLSAPIEKKEEEDLGDDGGPSPSPSGGGGGSSACTYNWVCTSWFPEPCPENGIQERLCVNKGTCTGIKDMPEQNRTCTFIEPIGPLFDISAKIPLLKRQVLPGGSVEVEIELFNIGDIEILDVFFKYWILNENNTLITEIQETKAIEEREKFEINIPIPNDVGLGNYRVFVQITYDDGKVAVAEDSFQIVESRISFYTRFGIFTLTALIIIIALVILFIRQVRKK